MLESYQRQPSSEVCRILLDIHFTLCSGEDLCTCYLSEEAPHGNSTCLLASAVLELLRSSTGLFFVVHNMLETPLILQRGQVL